MTDDEDDEGKKKLDSCEKRKEEEMPEVAGDDHHEDDDERDDDNNGKGTFSWLDHLLNWKSFRRNLILGVSFPDADRDWDSDDDYDAEEDKYAEESDLILSMLQVCLVKKQQVYWEDSLYDEKGRQLGMKDVLSLE